MWKTWEDWESFPDTKPARITKRDVSGMDVWMKGFKKAYRQ
jgi:hypothetical protein